MTKKHLQSQYWGACSPPNPPANRGAALPGPPAIPGGCAPRTPCNTGGLRPLDPPLF